MTSRRLQRVNEQLKREISRILRRDVHDPRVGLVLVTDVETSGDLSVASVYVRPAGQEKEWDAMMEGLEAAAPFVRRELAQDLEMRKVPELHFREDHTLEKAMRIEEILDRVLAEDSGQESDDDRDGEPVEDRDESRGGETDGESNENSGGESGAEAGEAAVREPGEGPR
ncbi:MAG: 30S ribosome-binding factor RbfA [Longimicrobiales bacterium]